MAAVASSSADDSTWFLDQRQRLVELCIVLGEERSHGVFQWERVQSVGSLDVDDLMGCCRWQIRVLLALEIEISAVEAFLMSHLMPD